MFDLLPALGSEGKRGSAERGQVRETTVCVPMMSHNTQQQSAGDRRTAIGPNDS